MSGWALTHVANHNPAFFFCPSMHWKTYHVFHWPTYQVFLLKFFCPSQFLCPDNSNIFHMFKNYILISEQPKTSWFLVISSKWFNRTKVSHNQTLIDCLAVKLMVAAPLILGGTQKFLTKIIVGGPEQKIKFGLELNLRGDLKF